MADARAEPALDDRARDQKRQDDQENRAVREAGVGLRRAAAGPSSTAAATANTDAVRIGNALTMTDAIAAAKTMNSRHAASVRPSGGGDEPERQRRA